MPGERNGVFRMSSFPDTPTHLLRKMIKQPVTDEENDAWAEFVELYEPVIRAYIAVEGVASSDADDAVQNVFMRLVGILRRGGYDRSKGRFRAYLKVVMRRVIIDLFRRQTAARMDVQVPFEEEVLTEDERYNETVMTRLRTSDGLNLAELDEKRRNDTLKTAKPHLKRGMMMLEEGVLRLSEQGFFVSNDIISDFML